MLISFVARTGVALYLATDKSLQIALCNLLTAKTGVSLYLSADKSLHIAISFFFIYC